MTIEVRTVATDVEVEFRINPELVGDAITRITGSDGDEWREQMYPFRTEGDIFRHWAFNATVNGVVDLSQLDGWADVPPGAVTFCLYVSSDWTEI